MRAAAAKAFAQRVRATTRKSSADTGRRGYTARTVVIEVRRSDGINCCRGVVVVRREGDDPVIEGQD